MMVKVYKDIRDDKLYVLDEMITMGTKVCLVPFDKGEDKFVAPSTLKRWYTKWEEVEYLVEVKAFTGMKIGLFKAVRRADGTIGVFTKNGKCLIFDVKTDEQLNATNPKYANKLGMTYGWMY